jgi:UDP-glucose-4-epimerase GalE
MRVLVTGGCGYIGSATARYMRAQGLEVVVVDDLSEGHRSAWDGTVEVFDLLDLSHLRGYTSRMGPFDGVIHFAARAYVGESVEQPLRYWRANLLPVLHLAEALPGVPIVLSSTCAVYGSPDRESLPETLPIEPVNPYGATKAAAERLLADRDGAGMGGFAALRYFNACGASADGRHGEDHRPENHLLPRAIAAALGRLAEPMQVFGTDWETPDGTCVRDYIHVDDLASAHLAALRHLAAGGDSLTLNLGTGRGHSVLEVLDAVSEAAGNPVPWEAAPRRQGDPARLVADASQAGTVLGWQPAMPALTDCVASAVRWHRDNPNGYPA